MPHVKAGHFTAVWAISDRRLAAAIYRMVNEGRVNSAACLPRTANAIVRVRRVRCAEQQVIDRLP